MDVDVVDRPRRHLFAAAAARTRAAIDANGWRYLTTIDLPPGMYQVRAVARVETSGAYGTVFLDLAVPDLARETIAIDSVVIGGR